ncbi:MAG: toxin-antitoxin system, antitoxin component [Patescibacteria group bacterium]
MLATKTRINISIPHDIRRALVRLAKRDEVPEATKAADLLARALETEEDEVWDAIARKRDQKGARFVPHKKAWA